MQRARNAMIGRWRKLAAGAAVAAVLWWCGKLGAAEQPAVVPFVKVVSDKTEDVSSLEAWQAGFITPGMSDEEKALAVWKTVVKFRHQAPPPNEFLQNEANVHDPIKTFNVYGYGMCCCASSNIECLSRHVGLQARGRAIHSHSVPEVQFDGAWHLLDASLITYFPNAQGKIASVDEIIASVTDWYAANPGFQGEDAKLRQFMRGEGWKKGPAVLAGSKFYSTNGWLPAATHGWYTTMAEYDGNPKYECEYEYSQGYRVNVALRAGEVLTRNWSNKGLHVNMKEQDKFELLNYKVGGDDLKYAVEYGDLAPGRIGNGSLVYTVPVGSPGLQAAALTYDNLKADAVAGVQVAAAGKPGVLVLRMPTSYVYLGGTLTGRATVAAGGKITVALSRNNGLDWQEIFKADQPGAVDLKVDVGDKIFRLYDYRLKFELQGAGTAVTALTIDQTIQHSQRSLPALGQGANTITISAGNPGALPKAGAKAPAPQWEGTVTAEATLQAKVGGGQVTYGDYHPTIENLKPNDWGSLVQGATGSITIPLAAPGDIRRVRFGGNYRAMGAEDRWDLQVSFDGGKSWQTAGTVHGPTRSHCDYVTFDQVPAGQRAVLVRFLATQKQEMMLNSFRVDVDYAEPRGGFQPVQVTYVWDEDGVEKKEVHVAKSPLESYTITCEKKPVLKSLVVELAK